MNEIIKKISPETNQKKDFGIKELSAFPESVQRLFQSLPQYLKERIIPELKLTEEEGQQTRELKLEEIIAGFDKDTREMFMAKSLYELLIQSRFKEKLISNKENMGKEIRSLMDLLWLNRGNRDNVKILNQEFYDNFLKQRKEIYSKILKKKEEVEKIKKKKLTVRKTNELKNLEEEVRMLTKELDEFDDANENSSYDYLYFNNVLSRQRKEKEWTESITIISEYLEPDEFATVMAEQIDIIFYKESQIKKLSPGGEFFGHKISKESIEGAKELLGKLYKVVEDWYELHKNDQRFKNPSEARLEEKQSKIIGYFASLMDSYKRGKESGRSDDDMLYSIRQMEVSLNILGK